MFQAVELLYAGRCRLFVYGKMYLFDWYTVSA
jgi:hypothetical protein